jgi:DNA-binding transcriptional MerR regulator
MTIKEIETLSGMERANIRFYEREGLISPKRMNNGYRDYEEDDLQILLRIKLLRSLHIPLDEIKALSYGTKDLADTLSKQIAKLDQEKQDASYAQDLCRAMREDHVTFADLNAKKYLDGIDRAIEETGSSYFNVSGDEIPQVFHPWRRFLARMLDIFMYTVLWLAFLAFVFHVNLLARSNFSNLLDNYIAVALMLVFEPLLLRLFGTTLGKAIFGLRVGTSNGRRLSYGDGLARTWGVIGAGMGYNLPIYSLVRFWKSYKLCSDKETQPWDECISYTIRDTKWYRGVLYAGTYAVLVFLMVATIYAQQLPPNRGDLTVAEFVENYNYYAEFFGVDFGDEYLDENGKWAQKAFDGTIHIEIGHTEMPEYKFTAENGYLTGISFEVALNNNRDWLGSYDTQMLLASIALAGAQDEMRLFSKIPGRIAEQIQNSTFEDFGFSEAGIEFSCDTEYSGYTDTRSGFLLPEEDEAETYFSLKFSIDKIK